MMTYTCIYEDPQGNIVVAPDCDFLSSVFDQPAVVWDKSPNAEAAIKLVVLNPDRDLPALYHCDSKGFRYALTDGALTLLIKQPVDGRFFMMIDEDCAVDPAHNGETMVSHCGGNPFPIDPTYTVNREMARRIALEFAVKRVRPEFCEWRAFEKMNVDWDKYL